MKSSNWTGKYPRTLDEAFGEGTPRRFAGDRKFRKSDFVLACINGALLAALIAASFAGWI